MATKTVQEIKADMLKSIESIEQEIGPMEESIRAKRDELVLLRASLAALDGQAPVAATPTRRRRAAAPSNGGQRRTRGTLPDVDEGAILAFMQSAGKPVAAGEIREGLNLGDADGMKTKMSQVLKAMQGSGQIVRQGHAPRNFAYTLA